MFIRKCEVFSFNKKSHLFGELAGLIRAGHDLVVEDREVEGKAQPGKKCKVLTNKSGVDGSLISAISIGSGNVSVDQR